MDDCGVVQKYNLSYVFVTYPVTAPVLQARSAGDTRRRPSSTKREETPVADQAALTRARPPGRDPSRPPSPVGLSTA